MKFTVEMRTVFKNENSPLKATANIVIEDSFVIRNIKLIDNGQGLFLSMPSFRGRDEKWHSVCHPIHSECREEIQNAVIAAYQQA
jgi:stage V sporulation protein G